MPLAIDLFCGLGGWVEGLLAEGWSVVGFDIERHRYGEHRYPTTLVLQDVLTLHGSQFRDADLIVASPPCQMYSYMAMPWSRARAIAAEYRSGKRDVAKLNELFDACFRIQREACNAAGRHIPMVVENVRGAIPWVGRCRWMFGPYALWGDVPALMPDGSSIAKQRGKPGAGKGGWFYGNYENTARRWSSQSQKRKEWSATIAKIPLPLSTWIARCFKPTSSPVSSMAVGMSELPLAAFPAVGRSTFTMREAGAQ